MKRVPAAAAVLAAVTGVVLPIAGLIAAAPASAGCETNVLGALYCDSPIRPDGTWDRCYTVAPTTNVLGGVIAPGAQKCYPVNPADGWPVVPMGQPQHHIYP